LPLLNGRMKAFVMSEPKRLGLFFLFLLIWPLSIEADEPLIFLISPMTSPVSSLAKFQPFAKYLENHLGKKVLIKQRKTYQEINETLKQNKAHFAYLCTGGYLAGRKEFNLELLAIPVIQGKKTYQAYVIVPKDSPYQKIEDLKGKVFAFTDPLSLTGHLFIRSYLKERGTSPEEFFKKTYFTGSHEKSIEAVAKNLADGASVDSLVFEEMKSKNHPFISKVRVIYTSQEFGMPPLVASPYLNKEDKLKLLQVLLKMDKDPEGKRILKEIGIDRFDPPDHTLYGKTQKILNLLR